MVPKGCQFTIPLGLIGSPLKVLVVKCVFLLLPYLRLKQRWNIWVIPSLEKRKTRVFFTQLCTLWSLNLKNGYFWDQYTPAIQVQSPFHWRVQPGILRVVELWISGPGPRFCQDWRVGNSSSMIWRCSTLKKMMWCDLYNCWWFWNSRGW